MSKAIAILAAGTLRRMVLAVVVALVTIMTVTQRTLIRTKITMWKGHSYWWRVIPARLGIED
jgi:hypothetical protein